MKQVLLALLTVMLSLSIFSGCSESERDTDLSASELATVEGVISVVEDVISVNVSSLPEGYTYSFNEESARAIVNYFANLNLISDFSENPYEYTGMTWVVSIVYKDGSETTLYHFGNMFVRREDGPWYRLEYGEASQFDVLLSELSKGQDSSDGKDTTVMYAKGTRVWDEHHPDDSERNPYFSISLSALDNTVIERKEDDKIYADGEYLTGGMAYYCENFYLCDLTGDGYPELCFTMALGSGFIHKRVEIIDYTTGTTIFTLDARGTYDYYLFLRNGVLCVAEVGLARSRTGILTCDGSEVAVNWDREADFRQDRDPLVSGEPIQ